MSNRTQESYADQIARRLAQLLKEKKWKVYNLAQKLEQKGHGDMNRTIHRLVQGKGKAPRKETIGVIADSLGVSQRYLEYGESSEQEPEPAQPEKIGPGFVGYDYPMFATVEEQDAQRKALRESNRFVVYEHDLLRSVMKHIGLVAKAEKEEDAGKEDFSKSLFARLDRLEKIVAENQQQYQELITRLEGERQDLLARLANERRLREIASEGWYSWVREFFRCLSAALKGQPDTPRWAENFMLSSPLKTDERPQNSFGAETKRDPISRCN